VLFGPKKQTKKTNKKQKNKQKKQKTSQMYSAHEMQRVGREFSSELIEFPINPALVSMYTPPQNTCDQLFFLEIKGEETDW